MKGVERVEKFTLTVTNPHTAIAMGAQNKVGYITTAKRDDIPVSLALVLARGPWLVFMDTAPQDVAQCYLLRATNVGLLPVAAYDISTKVGVDRYNDVIEYILSQHAQR